MSVLEPDYPLAIWEDIKKANIKQWEAQKAQCDKKCRLCGFPLPEVNVHVLVPSDRCSVCTDIETILYGRSYWGALNREEASRRGKMGL